MTLGVAIATLWFPSLNPFGIPSFLALGVSISGLFLTENWKRLHSDLAKATLTVIVPPVLFGFVVGSKVPIAAFRELALYFPWQSFRNFPNADDYLANYVYLAFGLLISLRAFRLPNIPFRFLGALEVVFLLLIIIVEFVALHRAITVN